MAERDLAAEIDALQVRVTVAEGEALSASHLLQHLLRNMVMAGVLTKHNAENIVDETLYTMEKFDVQLTEAGLLTVQARARLQEMLKSLAVLP